MNPSSKWLQVVSYSSYCALLSDSSRVTVLYCQQHLFYHIHDPTPSGFARERRGQVFRTLGYCPKPIGFHFPLCILVCLLIVLHICLPRPRESRVKIDGSVSGKGTVGTFPRVRITKVTVIFEAKKRKRNDKSCDQDHKMLVTKKVPNMTNCHRTLEGKNFLPALHIFLLRLVLPTQNKTLYLLSQFLSSVKHDSI